MTKKCEKFEIVGGKKLYGKVRVHASKNAILPIMSASLLCDGVVTLKSIPNILDIDNMISLLREVGVKIENNGSKLILDPRELKNLCINCKLSKTMRSSIFLLGSYLHRFNTLMITTPGGCNIGSRPIDLHLSALKRLGVKIKSLGDYIFFDSKNARSNSIKLKFPSVGATENIIEFAVKLKGKTVIKNAAREPEVVDLCNFLNLMGARILGAGTGKITIYGVDKLHSTEYIPMSDRIVAGTIMCAVAACGGEVEIQNVRPLENKKLIEKLISIGCQIKEKNDIITISRENNLTNFGEITTGCYPDFATDLQSLILPIAMLCDGKGRIEEQIFENRFLILDDLRKMGAKAKLLSSRVVETDGVSCLKGAQVMATDLRGGAGLVIAGLSAKGKTSIRNITLIDRGYDHLEEILSSLGADIRRK